MLRIWKFIRNNRKNFKKKITRKKGKRFFGFLRKAVIFRRNQYPITMRMIMNATNPIRALMGIVKIHAHMILRATPHFTVLAPIVVPTPMIDEQITWVVLTGIPLPRH